MLHRKEGDRLAAALMATQVYTVYGSLADIEWVHVKEFVLWILEH